MIHSTRRQAMMGAAATALAASTRTASAQTQLKVIVFPGHVQPGAIRRPCAGLLQQARPRGRAVYTPNSTSCARALPTGRYHIAHAGVDNAVAQVETAKVDLFIFMGGNNGFNSLFVQPEIRSYEDLRGKTMAVDAVDTAFALLLYKMLDLKGIKRSEYEVEAGRRDASARYQAMIKDKTYAACDAQPAVLDRRRARRAQGFGSAVERDRTLPVGRRLGAALLGQGQCATR